MPQTRPFPNQRLGPTRARTVAVFVVVASIGFPSGVFADDVAVPTGNTDDVGAPNESTATSEPANDGHAPGDVNAARDANGTDAPVVVNAEGTQSVSTDGDSSANDGASPTDSVDAVDACLLLAEQAKLEEAARCLDDVKTRHPERAQEVERIQRAFGTIDTGSPKPTAVDDTPTEDAKPDLREDGVPDAAVAPTPIASDDLLPRFLKPGRLELAAVTGIYGVWAGVTSGILLGTNSDQYLLNIDPSLIILGTGGAGVGLGLAGLAGGYALADVVDIDQGNAWAYTAGMTWGASYAIALLPAIYDVQRPPWWLEDEMDLGLPLLGGGVGALTSFGLSLVADTEISEVSMMNTGGWTAGAAGMLIGFNMVMWTEGRGLRPGLTMASTYTIGKTAGLAMGLLASEFLNYTWGETLLGDVGVILGGLLTGSAAFAFVSSPLAEPTMIAVFGSKDSELFGKTALTLTSASAIGGGMAGLLTTTVGLYVFHRWNGVPFIRDDLPFQVTPMQMGFVVDREGQAAPSLALINVTM